MTIGELNVFERERFHAKLQKGSRGRYNNIEHGLKPRVYPHNYPNESSGSQTRSVHRRHCRVMNTFSSVVRENRECTATLLRIADRHDSRLNTITRRSAHPGREGNEGTGCGASHGKHNVIKTRAERGRATRAFAHFSQALSSARSRGDFLNFSGLILTAEPRVTPGKSSVPRTKPLIAPAVITFASAPRSRSRCLSAVELIWDTKHARRPWDRLKTEIIQLA